MKRPTSKISSIYGVLEVFELGEVIIDGSLPDERLDPSAIKLSESIPQPENGLFVSFFDGTELFITDHVEVQDFFRMIYGLPSSNVHPES